MAVLDDNFELLPDDELEIDPDAELDAAFRDEPEDEDPEVTEPQRVPFGRSWGWDFNANRFVTYGAGPAETHGLETLKTWIMKAISTARGAHPIYDIGFGMDDPTQGIGFVDDMDRQSLYQRSIIEALMVHDRIQQVTNFIFSNDGVERLVEFTVLTDTDDAIAITDDVNTEPMNV